MRREPREPRPRSPHRLAAAALCAVLVLAACGDDDDDDGAASDTTTAEDGTTAPPESGPATSAAEGTEAPVTTSGGTATTSAGTAGEGEGGDVVVGAVLEPTSLDIITVAGAALDQILLDNVYETLLKAGPDGEIGPGLAAPPEVSDDATAYTFTIEEGVSFHDGQPLTSADVKWSLEALSADGATEAPELAAVETVEAPDDQTVVVTLAQPDSDFTFQLTRRAGAVLPAEVTDIENTAVGTGPFVFDEWNVGSSISLRRNPDYWGEAPSIDALTFLYFTDPNAAVNAFTTGDVDILTGVNPDLVGPLQEDSEYIVNEGETTGEFTLGMNNGRPPFDNPEVRRAVRQAIDKEAYRELNNGFGTIIGGPVPPSDPWYEDLTDVAPYDPAAATALLEGAGYGDGLDVTLAWPNIYPTTNAEFVASQLGEVGINVTIETIEFAVWLEQVFTNADYDMTAVLHVEPRDIGNYANPDYYWRYDNPEVQQLIGDAKTSTDPDESVELLKQAARLISEDSPVDWLGLAADLTVSRTDVTGYPTDNTASRFDASGITLGG